ncbi:FAD-dependent tricarballylate dehydrogenase TcuA [Pseudomonas matsuisoli]|uniref:Tricarballylate dehydrogenase n=1 Tax=Pseudomonas matsuisoli TaxID=1515666 RepID=A0A917PUU7_9PSED|nr:FAD-dependent tricarballylate dehydrogenase TcuA [Pseudomonas matsuisoli]GGJ92710.1 tricarballylate dehydrogenase [Pseudomonas matsuisoli]
MQEEVLKAPSGSRTGDPLYPDVLVVGGGNAALCAAIRAAEEGRSVLLVEHAPQSLRGGNSQHTRNFRCMHEGPKGILSGAYPEEEYYADLLRVTAGKTTPALARMVIRQTTAAYDWMEEHGVRFQPSLGGTLSLSRTNAFFLGGGRALVNAYYHTAERLGVHILYDTEATALTVEEGVFRFAVIQYKGIRHEVHARALVLASGGFESNLEWLEEAWGPSARNFLIRGTRFNRGRMLKEMMRHGASIIGEPDQCHAVAIDGRAPQFDGGIVTRLDCVSFGIVVNEQAQRFYDEGEDFWPKRYAIWGRLVAAQANQVGHVIIDSKALNDFMPSVFPPLEADSIEALAERLGLEPAALRKTVDDFNAAIVADRAFDNLVLDGLCTRGLAVDKTNWARPICDPPFYGYTLAPGITFTYMGVEVDEKARVLFEKTGASPNIYAAGEIMAGNILGQGYTAGIGMAIGTVFGLIAGEEAAHASR